MALDFEEYEEFTETTDISNQSLQFYLDGMSEEGGELSGVFKRIRRGDFGAVPMVTVEDRGLAWVIENFPEIKKAIVSEIGDRHWYSTRFLNKIKVTWGEVMDYNHVKLKKRDEDGTIMGHGEERTPVPEGDDSMPVSLDRYKFMDIFSDFLEKEGFSSYGTAEKESLRKNCDEFGRFKNDVFELSAYWWGECTCGSEPGYPEMYSGPDAHKKDCMIYVPNFVYKPTNIKIDWYKYPFRGMTANREFTKDEFREAIRHCERSLE